MPRGNFSPIAALGVSPDLEDGVELDLFSRVGGDPVSLERAIWPDPVALVSGRAVRTNSDLTSQALSIGLTSVSVDAADRVAIAGPEPFEVLAGASNTAWGIAAAGQASADAGGGVHLVVAESDWRGGPFEARITIRRGGADFLLPTLEQRTTSFIHLLRSPATVDVDADGVTECIEARDNAANSALGLIRWLIDDRGHLVSVWPVGVAGDIVWDTSTAERRRLLRRLGRSGAEVHQTVNVLGGGQLRVWRADRPMAWLLVPSRPIARPGIIEGLTELARGGRTKGGRTVANTVDRYFTCELGWQVDGPGMGLDADLTEHWRLHVEPFLHTDQVTVWQDWSEQRRVAYLAETDDVDLPYTLLRTAENRGRVGRLICSRPMDDSHRRQLRYRGNRNVADLPMRLDVLDPEAP